MDTAGQGTGVIRGGADERLALITLNTRHSVFICGACDYRRDVLLPLGLESYIELLGRFVEHGRACAGDPRGADKEEAE